MLAFPTRTGPPGVRSATRSTQDPRLCVQRPDPPIWASGLACNSASLVRIVSGLTFLTLNPYQNGPDRPTRVVYSRGHHSQPNDWTPGRQSPDSQHRRSDRGLQVLVILSTIARAPGLSGSVIHVQATGVGAAKMMMNSSFKARQGRALW
ncbi:hypothetical protein BD413DRAFT_521810 [Trametes elegans]|nr:hypothetical protein BD413DRAFT_521810 [Trametes elegans]